MRASLPQPGGDVEQPISLCANVTSSTKPEMRNVSLSRQRGQTTGNMHKKINEDRRVVLEI